MDRLSEDCIRRAAAGDETAFAAIVTSYQKTEYHLALSTLHDREEALDASQEIFLKVFRFLPDFHFQSSFSTWLYRIARNTVTDILRSRGRRPCGSVDELAEQGWEPPDAAEGADPFAGLLKSERRRLLTESMENLSEPHREILRLYAFAGESYESIAALLGIEIGTVKSRISRAKKELRNLLAERNFF